MSAASFLGIAGLISLYGYDGFMYSVGWLVAYVTVLLIVAEPCRNAGKYTNGRCPCLPFLAKAGSSSRSHIYALLSPPSILRPRWWAPAS